MSPGVINTLVYMRDVEGFTSSYLTGVGAHKTTVGDPIVGEFLEVWKAEEAAHANAIERYLSAYSAATGVTVAARALPQRPADTWYERLLVRVGGPVGRLVAAAHMTWRAANELLTLNGYRLLADRCGDPLLSELLRRIAAQEARHYSFYLLQAEWRLATSRLARLILPRVLGSSWTPVGIGDGYKDPEEFQHVVDLLTSDPDCGGVIERMDRRLAALPGLAGLHIYRTAMTSGATAA